jgi:anaerobic magnesium-protoporphyrin IX monomethyl ester cyclase
MKIALIQPVTGTESTKVVRVVREPLGLLYIASAINDAAFCADIKTTQYEARIFHPIERVEPRAVIPWEDEVLISRVKDYNPDAIGISTMTYNYEKGIEIANKIKESIGNVPIIFGGYHVSGCARQYIKWLNKPDNEIFLNDLENIFKTGCVDYIVIGEGEKTIIELLECLRNDGEINKVEGIAYSQNGNAVITRNRERLPEPDSLPIPDRSQLDWNKYKSSVKGDTVGTIHTMRGCRFACAYCSTPTTWGPKVSERSPKNVVNEIEYLVTNFSINRITFADEDFTSDFDRINRICNEIKRRDIHIKWDSFANIDDILKEGAEDTLMNMRDAGCVSFFVGIESLNIKTLIDYNRPKVKKYTIDEYLKRVQKAIDTVSAAGIDFYGDYMVGYPGETEDEMRKGFERLKSLRNMPYIYLPILNAFPGTCLYEKCKKNDWILKGKTFKDFDCSQQLLKGKNGNVVELRDQFEIEFYTNNNYIEDCMNRIKTDPGRLDQIMHLYAKLSSDYPDNERLLFIKEKFITLHE